MEKKQLLLITENSDFANCIEHEAELTFETTVVKDIHLGYRLALNYLPDVILVDYASLGLESLKSLKKFKASHFLKKSFLFLFGDEENRKVLDRNFSENVDGIFYDQSSYSSVIEEMRCTINNGKCPSNYWKDSFMGLFNLMDHPVVLLQGEKVIAMNDAFRNDFFITGSHQLRLTDLVTGKNRNKVKETLRKFIKSKHMKASTTTVIVKNGRLREAKISFSKLDKGLKGQLILMINFTGKETPLNENIGTCSVETENGFENSDLLEEQSFTKREKEVISLLCKGYKTKEISDALCISSKTIEKHRANIIKRTHSGTILESIVYALNHKMIEV